LWFRSVAVDPAAAFAGEPPYRLDSRSDKLRVMVFGQEGPHQYLLRGPEPCTIHHAAHQDDLGARASPTDELARTVAERLRRGFIRRAARPDRRWRPIAVLHLGEVTLPGQYAYVPHMTWERDRDRRRFTPRAYRWDIKLDRPAPGRRRPHTVAALTRVRPGDTIIVKNVF